MCFLCVSYVVRKLCCAYPHTPRPNTPVAFGVRTLDWMLNHNSQWLAKVRKPLDVVGVEVSALEEVKALHKEWRPVEHRMSEFMYL